MLKDSRAHQLCNSHVWFIHTSEDGPYIGAPKFVHTFQRMATFIRSPVFAHINNFILLKTTVHTTFTRIFHIWILSISIRGISDDYNIFIIIPSGDLNLQLLIIPLGHHGRPLKLSFTQGNIWSEF